MRHITLNTRKYFQIRKNIWYQGIYIDITAALRAVLNIARACACNILYLHEGASPRRRYFRIARRAQRARVLYDGSALEARMISCISMSGRFSSVVVMPLIRWSFTKFYKCKYIHNVIYPQVGVYHEASVSNNHSKLMYKISEILRENHVAFSLRCRTGQNDWL